MSHREPDPSGSSDAEKIAQRTGGMSSRWSRMLVATGVAIACVNMSLAWTMMFQRPCENISTRIEKPTEEAKRPAVAARRPPLSDDANMIMERMFRTLEQNSARSHSVTILVLAFSFALLAIGFSLFVMGVEGALHFGVSADDLGSLAIKMASPGLRDSRKGPRTYH